MAVWSNDSFIFLAVLWETSSANVAPEITMRGRIRKCIALDELRIGRRVGSAQVVSHSSIRSPFKFAYTTMMLFCPNLVAFTSFRPLLAISSVLFWAIMLVALVVRLFCRLFWSMRCQFIAIYTFIEWSSHLHGVPRNNLVGGRAPSSFWTHLDHTR